MKFNVKGITFSKDELSTIALKEIDINTISRSHLFFIPSSGKAAFMLLRAGDFIEPEFIEKYLDRGMESIYQLEVANVDDSMLFRKYFKSPMGW